MLTRNDSLKSTRNCYLNQNTVKYIVVHYTACDAPARNFALSQMNNDLGGSAHDFVDSTSWYCAIDHKHGAWAVGDNQGYGVYPNGITNYNSLNIEMVAPPWQLPPTKTIENTAEIVAYYMKVYNVPISRVVRHYDASYKQCPYGMHGNNNPVWNSFKAKVQAYYNGTVANNTTNNQEENGVNRSMYVFSKNWYLKAYSDVAKNKTYKDDPYKHYADYGKKEGRKPLPPIPAEFCEGDYLELNPDVAEAVKKGSYVSGIHHYLMYGFNEPNRKINKNETEEDLKKRVEELEKELKEEKERIKKIKDIVNE